MSQTYVQGYHPRANERLQDLYPERFDAGIRAFHRTTEADGALCYTFFKGVGGKRREA